MLETNIQMDCMTIDSARARSYWKNSEISRIRLAEGCKRIGECAFGFSSLRHIELPNTLQVIDACAFIRTVQLRSIIIPEGTEFLGDMAFAGCSNLEKIALPSTLREVGELPFFGCTRLKRIEMPAEVIDAFKSSKWMIDHKEKMVELVDGVPSWPDQEDAQENCLDQEDAQESDEAIEVDDFDFDDLDLGDDDCLLDDDF